MASASSTVSSRTGFSRPFPHSRVRGGADKTINENTKGVCICNGFTAFGQPRAGPGPSMKANILFPLRDVRGSMMLEGEGKGSPYRLKKGRCFCHSGHGWPTGATVIPAAILNCWTVSFPVRLETHVVDESERFCNDKPRVALNGT